MNDEQETAPFIWTPITLTDRATGRKVNITIFERELYLSGFFTFEDFWQGEHPNNNEGNDENVQDQSASTQPEGAG